MMTDRNLLLTVIANLTEGECSRLLHLLSNKDTINIHIHILDYIHHEEHCKSMKGRFFESDCDCGLYEVYKDHKKKHDKYFYRICNEGE